jgi:hypothetical protein
VEVVVLAPVGFHTVGLLRDMPDSRVILQLGPEPDLFSTMGSVEEAEACARVIRGWLDHCEARPHVKR